MLTECTNHCREGYEYSVPCKLYRVNVLWKVLIVNEETAAYTQLVFSVVYTE